MIVWIALLEILAESEKFSLSYSSPCQPKESDLSLACHFSKPQPWLNISVMIGKFSFGRQQGPSYLSEWMAFNCYYCHVVVLYSFNTWMKLSGWSQSSWSRCSFHFWTYCREKNLLSIYFPSSHLMLLLFAFQSMFISIWVSRLEIAEFLGQRPSVCSLGLTVSV